MERRLTWTAAVLAGAVGIVAVVLQSTDVGWVACAFVVAFLLSLQL